MKSLFIATILLSSSVHAFAEMKPGLWKITSTQKVDGKTANTDLNKMMGSLSPEQKKKLMESQKKMGINVNTDGSIDSCYTVQKFRELGNPRKDCKNTVVQQTPIKSISTFKCKDGTTGEVTSTMTSPESFSSDTLVINSDKTSITSQVKGTFIKADCGDLE